MKIIISGTGISVYFLAKRFISKGYHITLISDVMDDCDYYARYLKATVIYGDCTDPDILNQAKVHDADLFIAMNDKDQNNLVSAQMASIYYKIPRILAVVNDPDNESIFAKLGIKAISGTKFLIEIIDNLSVLDEIKQQTPMVEGRVLITEVVVTEQSKCVGQALRDIVIPYSALISCILRLDDVIIPRGNTVILSGDRLLLITMPDTHNFVLNILL